MPLELPTRRMGLLLRQLRITDAEVMYALIDSNREHLSQWDADTASKYQNLESVRRSITTPKNFERLRFGIWDDDHFVGTTNLTPLYSTVAELGYWVGHQFCSRGFATEASRAVVLCAFQIQGFLRVRARARRENVPSQKVLTKVGFELLPDQDDRFWFKYVLEKP